MPSGVVNIYAKRETRNDRKLQLANSQISVNEEALRAFEELNFALIESYPEFELLILAGMPTDGTTGSLSCSDGNKELPASDHAAGYALDARYTTKVDDKTVSYQFSDPIVALQTAFLFEKGAKLGIIQSPGPCGRAHLLRSAPPALCGDPARLLYLPEQSDPGKLSQ